MLWSSGTKLHDLLKTIGILDKVRTLVTFTHSLFGLGNAHLWEKDTFLEKLKPRGITFPNISFGTLGSRCHL